MMLLNKRARDVGAEEIERLVSGGIAESKTLDYKREIRIDKDSDKKEFLYDLAALANTDGGVIIVGIDERKDSQERSSSVAGEVVGFKIENEEQFKQRVEDLVYSSIEPRVGGLHVRFVEVGQKQVLLIAVERFVGLPHMVTLGKTNKFYRRNSASKYLMDVYELNEAFAQNARFKDAVTSFRNQRIEQVSTGQYHPGIEKKTSFFMQVIPFGRIGRPLVEISDHTVAEYLRTNMKPMFGSGWSHRFNLDGLMTYYPGSGVVHDYVQAFRDGVIEFYTSQMHFSKEGGDVVIHGRVLENKCIKSATDAIKLLGHTGVEAPYVILISILHTRSVAVVDDRWRLGEGRIFAERVLLPEVLIGDSSTDVSQAMKSSFDVLWQASGYQGSPCYGSDGKRLEDANS
ncbi:MAG: ATP-binding protein [Flavobacteriales bacterium]|nr:ATP-binding protein [Flavobacteriales bacterium]